MCPQGSLFLLGRRTIRGRPGSGQRRSVRGAGVPVDTCHRQRTHPRVLLFRTLGCTCMQARTHAHTHTHLRLPVALPSSVADGHIGEHRVGDVSVVKVALCNRSRTDAIVKIDVDAARPSAFRVRHHQVPICLSISFNGKIVYKFIHARAVRDVHRSSSDALRLKTKCTPLSLLAASLLSLTRLPNLLPPRTHPLPPLRPPFLAPSHLQSTPRCDHCAMGI